MPELTDEMIPGLVQALIRQQLRDDREGRAVLGVMRAKDAAERDSLPVGHPRRRELDAELSESPAFAPKYKGGLFQMERDLKNLDFSQVMPLVEKALLKAGITFDQESQEYATLCLEALKGQFSVELAVERRNHGNIEAGIEYEQEDAPPAAPVPSAPALPATLPRPGAGRKLSDSIAAYVEEAKKGNLWTRKTELDFTASLNLLLEVLGDVETAGITREDMVRFKNVLMRLPRNRNKIKKYRGMSIQEVLDTAPEDTLSVTTVNNILKGRMAVFFGWAEANSHVTTNPAQKLGIATKRNASKERAKFTPDDIARLFSSGVYADDSHVQGYTFWFPVIGLLSGMRREEIAQLLLEDIRQESGVWFFDVNRQHGKTVKTDAGQRTVPLHPFLAKTLDLPGYAERLRKAGHSRLFPELKRDRDGYGKVPGEWFNEVHKAAAGIQNTEEGKKTFHSFRHTFTDFLVRRTRDELGVKILVGHSLGGDVTLGRYFDGKDEIATLAGLVNQIDYGVDLSHLAASKVVQNPAWLPRAKKGGKSASAKPKAKRRSKAGKK